MRLFAVLVAVCALSACSTARDIASGLDTRQNVGVCPAVGSLYDASRQVKFAQQPEQYDNIAYTAEITDVRMFCRYTEGNPVQAELEIDFAFGKGPRAVENLRNYRYWIAVTRRSGKVLNKEYFSVWADFSEDDVVGVTDTVSNIVIPRLDETISAANFEIIVGLDLSAEELAFNQEGRRFRLGAGD